MEGPGHPGPSDPRPLHSIQNHRHGSPQPDKRASARYPGRQATTGSRAEARTLTPTQPHDLEDQAQRTEPSGPSLSHCDYRCPPPPSTPET